nr:hypothetical protein CFP56_78773 [Quercus suber]
MLFLVSSQNIVCFAKVNHVISSLFNEYTHPPPLPSQAGSLPLRCQFFFISYRIAATTLPRGGSDGYCDDNGKPRNLIFRNLGGTTKAVGAGHRQAGPCAIPIVTRQSVVERPSFSDPNFYSSRAGPCLVFPPLIRTYMSCL